jgi:hypothetical protein
VLARVERHQERGGTDCWDDMLSGVGIMRKLELTFSRNHVEHGCVQAQWVQQELSEMLVRFLEPVCVGSYHCNG